MSSFNLSDWALRHQSFVVYMLGIIVIAGLMAYFTLGRAEDPEFTIKTMVVSAEWPGATAREMEQQVTDRLEKKLQETPFLDFVQSFSEPGHSLIFVNLKDYAPNAQVPNAWYEVRKKLRDIGHTLPEGVQGPFFNDEFGDTYGTIYAFTADGFNYAELKDAVDNVRQELLRIPDVAKVDLIGVQQEKVYIEISHRKLATLGIDPRQISETLREQNEMNPAGSIETVSDQIYLRVSGDLKSVEAIREIGIEANGKQFRLGDIARIYRAYAEPINPKFRYQGEDAIGLAVAMTKGGDILSLGDRLSSEIERLKSDLPTGIDIHQVSDQPKVVMHSVNEFMKTLIEAVIIVLGVSFLSLGWRTGLVVALSIPLVLAITFVVMKLAGIDLQRISLGALIIALGLLVDDAIISVEMMVVKMEQGWDRIKAATFAYTSTSFPILLGEVNIQARNGKAVPLSQLVRIEYGFEEGIIWRRDRFPTFTVRSDIRDDVQAPDVAAEIEPLLAPIRAKLPAGYRIELGGAVESSAKAEASINAVMPIMLFTLVTLLMMQLQSIKRTAMVLLTAPLGMIGVTAFLLIFSIPFGFVATLGVIALAGMIMRNSIILVDQIDQDIDAGYRPWDAIIEAAVRRLRPILLTAAAAILAMIPLTASVFWGPMAVAIMGGLLVATVLTMLFLPALYATWFGITEE